MTVPAFPEKEALRVVREALREDLGQNGDITTRAVFPGPVRGRGRLVAREEVVLAGIRLASLVMEAGPFPGADPVRVLEARRDGERLGPGEVLAVLEGDVRTLLAGERVLLNLLQRLCGIATLTAACVAEIAGTGARVADTRKTTPGLRALEKYAVAVAGGENHRMTLDGMILLKDNHKELAGGLREALSRVLAGGHDPSAIEVEVDSLEELQVALEFRPGWILLDNMGPEHVREAVRLVGGRARIEVSGGLRPGHLRPWAEAGADRLSLGALTHSVRAVDIGLDI